MTTQPFSINTIIYLQKTNSSKPTTSSLNVKTKSSNKNKKIIQNPRCCTEKYQHYHTLLEDPKISPNWDGYLKDQIQITEIQGADEYSVWDILSRDFEASQNFMKIEGEEKGKKSDT